MASFHIREDGEPGLCRAEKGNCPLGGEHFSTPDAAREAYESDMADLAVLEGKNKKFNRSLSPEQKKFFTPGNEGNYTLIDTTTGAVFGANSVVIENPYNDDIYEYPMDFIEDGGYNAVPLSRVPDIEAYRDPLIIEPDTGLVVGVVKDYPHLYAIDTSKEIVDFDEILESDRAAAEAAQAQGFLLWGK